MENHGKPTGHWENHGKGKTRELGTTQLELSSGSFSVQKAFQAEHSERIFTHFFKTKSCLTHVREGLATLCEALVSWE